jgi:hypothetical protein
MAYHSEDEWNMAWQHPWSTTDFRERKGQLTKLDDGTWVAVVLIPSRWSGNIEVSGEGDTSLEAIHDCWENWLNFNAPESLQADRAGLMLRGAGNADFQKFRIKGYDDE